MCYKTWSFEPDKCKLFLQKNNNKKRDKKNQ